MSEVLYSQLPSGTSSTYTWSSTGPSLNGDVGVDVIAPGGAFQGVPGWCLTKGKMMNGTSMSCPNAAGGVCILVSMCKSNGLEYTPERIRKAVCNTARPQAGLTILEQGWGMIDVEKAWAWIYENRDVWTEDVRYSVEVAGGRGIHFRGGDEVYAKTNHNIWVKPAIGHGEEGFEERKKEVSGSESGRHGWNARGRLFAWIRPVSTSPRRMHALVH